MKQKISDLPLYLIAGLFIGVIWFSCSSCSKDKTLKNEHLTHVVMNTDFYTWDSTYLPKLTTHQDLGYLGDSTLKVLIETAKAQDRVLRQCYAHILCHYRYDVGDSLSYPMIFK